MRNWAVEHGSLWALEPRAELPPMHSARIETAFGEVAGDDASDLASAMGLSSTDVVQQRLESDRRCFVLRTAGKIAAYGWVTRGAEQVGELERQFHLHGDEAYIWDCATVPEWRRQGCYSALLSSIVETLHREGLERIWIGSSRQNQPSLRAFANAGFEPVLDLVYRRFLRLTTMWISLAPTVSRALAPAAYRILIDPHERRFGRLVIGFKR